MIPLQTMPKIDARTNLVIGNNYPLLSADEKGSVSERQVKYGGEHWDDLGEPSFILYDGERELRFPEGQLALAVRGKSKGTLIDIWSFHDSPAQLIDQLEGVAA